ncbi:MAG: 50S ribosomal protein L15 [Pseudomonadaceae bacterium]|nr:50S ribosomal protein L15 [Pseudomonadaceae bacterium]
MTKETKAKAENVSVSLNTISDNEGAMKRLMRVGRGRASGKGKTSGRGVKGQKARKSGNVRAGFEGGQNPLYRRLPMRGFNNKNFTTTYTVVNIGTLQAMIDDGRLDAKNTITIESIIAAGLTKKPQDGLKVLGNGELKAKLSIVAAAATQSAVKAVEAAGGKIDLLPKKVYEGKLKPKAER